MSGDGALPGLPNSIVCIGRHPRAGIDLGHNPSPYTSDMGPSAVGMLPGLAFTGHRQGATSCSTRSSARPLRHRVGDLLTP